MITFKKIRWANFLSTGDVATEINLRRSKTTLVVGENGAGKSTMLDAISFALFGKPFRSINKTQLVNTINNKALLVELEFDVNGREYMIKRGIKPTVFEIYQDGKLVNQDSASKEYQEYLEENILKMTQKSFSQTVVIGSASFVPFMQLPAGHRREVIEDLLDIQVFSTMNQLLKERISANKAAIQENDHQIKLTERTIELTKRNLEALKRNDDETISNLNDNISKHRATIKGKVAEVEALQQELAIIKDSHGDRERVESAVRQAKLNENALCAKLKLIETEVAFLHKHDNCPTCKQGIAHDFKDSTIGAKNSEIEDIAADIQRCVDVIVAVEEQLDKYTDDDRRIAQLNKDIASIMTEMRISAKFIEDFQQEIKRLEAKQVPGDVNEDEVLILEQTKAEQMSHSEELYQRKDTLDMAAVLLKDGGIKAKIIKQYVPVMNKLINKYLAAMDFFVNFELDENFNETIKSRFRDEFSYASFSEGEKMRIDLALLFTWRAISKLRNSTCTNLLILDEIFDGSLDSTGTDEFLKILNTVDPDTNVFVISHKTDQMYDKFHSIIKFEKHKSFSRIAS